MKTRFTELLGIRYPIVQASHLGLLLRGYEALGMSPGPDLDRVGMSSDAAEDPEARVGIRDPGAHHEVREQQEQVPHGREQGAAPVAG